MNRHLSGVPTFIPPTGGDAPRLPVLLDEGDMPDFRRLFGALLAQSSALDTALLRIRLGAVDLSGHETASLRSLRILVGEMNALTLEEEAFTVLTDPDRAENLHRILALLREGKLEIRSAPLAGWSPDFSVFSRDGRAQALLLGLHWFQRPFPHRGPAWAVALGPREARRARTRFQGLWSRSHDIGPAVLHLLDRVALRVAALGEKSTETRAGAALSGPP